MEPTGSAEAVQIASTDVAAYPRRPNSASAASRITSADGAILSWPAAERARGLSVESAAGSLSLTALPGRSRPAAVTGQCERPPFVRARLGSGLTQRWTDTPLRPPPRPARQFARARPRNAAHGPPQRDQTPPPSPECRPARGGAHPGW